jgi:PPP family 3-phenylpropionic acid transporter
MLTVMLSPPSDDVGKRRRGLAARLSLMQAANFAGIGLYLPFFPVWLSAQGLSDRQIGLALALGMVVRMLAAQPVAAFGDRKPGAVRILIALQLASAAAYAVLMALQSPAAIIAGSVAVALISAGVIPLGDYLVGAQVRRDGALDYARIRLWGSVSFLIVSIGGGMLLARAGASAIPLGLIACCLAAALAARLVPEPPAEAPADAAASGPAAAPERARLLWLLIIASALVNASHAAIYGFGSLHWRGIGIADTMIGALWAAGVVAEIAVFWLLGPTVARSLRNAMLALAASALVAMLRFGLLPLAADPASILALQLTHAVTFGAQHMAVIAIASALAPAGRRALIQGRISAANACLMGVVTLGSGYLYEAAGPAVFVAMVPVAAAGLAITLAAMALARRLPPLDRPVGPRLPVTLDTQR